MKKTTTLKNVTSFEDEYTFSKKELQHIIDAIFEMVYRVGSRYGGDKFENNRETDMKWVQDQLRYFGIDTISMGMSWGVLK